MAASGLTSLYDALRANTLTTLDGVGVVLLTAVLLAVHGVWGFVAGVAVLGAAAVWSGGAAFVLAQLFVISLVPAGATWTVVGTQVAAFFLLASVAAGWPPRWRRLGELALAYPVALGLVWILQANLRWLWQSALVLVVAAATIAYALHRYERVALGLVAGEVER
ncbi:hypothetical protein [Halobellus ordinarius]|uniref:hypothetical protein n=1 Tax=Halobellus ordinarius TaxID=3075120 RepID=UPI002880BA0B|nr:hypothetical protein [Halobellus sp. ZY16]